MPTRAAVAPPVCGAWATDRALSAPRRGVSPAGSPWRCLAALLFTPLAAVHAADGLRNSDEPPGFPPIERAAIDPGGGRARLLINGRPVVPMVFFFNTRQGPDYVVRFQDPQVRFSSAAGVHIYSFLMPGAVYDQGWGQVDYSATERILEDFIRADPQALFILRYPAGPTPSWREWRDIPEHQLWRYADGSYGAGGMLPSLASECYRDLSDKGTTDMIRHFEGGRYGPRILAYHIGGPNIEMFPDEYREKGPDVSAANTDRFRKWLAARYRDDAALQRSWGDSRASLAAAAVPSGDPGRFPMRSSTTGDPIEVFYRLPEEQCWVDYSRYVSELTADRVIRWAELVKRETAGRKLSVFFYGYVSELIGSFNGHGAVQRVLEHPAVDVLVSPVPYQHRLSGQSGGFMSPVDSVIAHGKLWLNEDDLRTHLVRKEDIPAWLTDGTFGRPARDMHETLNLLDRNFAHLLVHRAGGWWMDLAGAGAFNAPEPWAMLRERMQWYSERVLDRPGAFHPDVAVLFDPESKYHVKSDWDAFYWNLMDLRDSCARSGVSVGWFTVGDFLRDTVPPCKAYFFANAFHLDAADVAAIRARLDREGATAIWCYAAGYFGPDGADLAQTETLTGMHLRIDVGEQGSVGAGALAGITWGPQGRGKNGGMPVSPRFVVEAPAAETLGRYKADGLVSAARSTAGGHPAVYLADMGVSSALLGELFGAAGAHRWLRGGELVLTDGRFLAVHSRDAGIRRIELPSGIAAQPLNGRIVRDDGSAIEVDFAAGETRWFRLTPRSEEPPHPATRRPGAPRQAEPGR